MSGVSRFVRAHSGGYSEPSIEAGRNPHSAASRPLACTTQPTTPNQAIEIDFVSEISLAGFESVESVDFDSDSDDFTSKPAAMSATDRDTKAAENSNHPRLNLKRKLNEYLKSSDTVDIFVGPELTKWTLHEELLCNRIPYFKAAFKNGFKESQDKKLELPEDSPEAFGHLVDWLYMEKLTCTVCDDSYKACSKDQTENPNHVLPWAQLWVLADKLGSEKLMALASSNLKDCMYNLEFEVSPELPELIFFVFEKTRETSFLRALVVEPLVEFFFQSDSYPDTFGEAAAASKTFNAEFWKRIKAHMGKKEESCLIYNCTLHESNRLS